MSNFIRRNINEVKKCNQGVCLNELANEILSKFHTRSNKKRAFIVGIDGLGGAGKTTFVHQLHSELKYTCRVVVIHIDDHIVEKNKRYHTGYEEWYEYYYLQWDIDMLMEELFKKISSYHPELTLPFYEKLLDNFMNKTISITPDTIVLIEGIFLQRKEWKVYYDYTVFIDCPREIRYKRVLKRDTYLGDEQARLCKYKRRYWLGEDYYLKAENPIKLADKVYECI